MTKDDIIEIAGKRLIRLSTFAEEMGLHIRTVQLGRRSKVCRSFELAIRCYSIWMTFPNGSISTKSTLKHKENPPCGEAGLIKEIYYIV